MVWTCKQNRLDILRKTFSPALGLESRDSSISCKYTAKEENSASTLVFEQIQVPSRDSHEHGCHLFKLKANGRKNMSNFFVN